MKWNSLKNPLWLGLNILNFKKQSLLKITNIESTIDFRKNFQIMSSNFVEKY